MGIYILHLGIFIASLVVVIFEITEIASEIKNKPRNHWRLLGSIFVLGLVTVLGAWGKLYNDATINEEFSIGKGNIVQRGESENIYLITKYKISDLGSLKIKDTWTYFQPGTDYDKYDDNTIFLKFIFREDKTKNMELAQHGLMFTYKSRLFLFSSAYFNYCLAAD